MTEFVRMYTDQKILEVSPEEAHQLINTNRAGATATFGIVQFLKDWTNPANQKKYSAGDFEKFDDKDPAQKAIADNLKSSNIARPIDR